MSRNVTKRFLLFACILVSFIVFKECAKNDTREAGKEIKTLNLQGGIDTVKIIKQDFWTGKVYVQKKDSTTLWLE